MKKSILLPSFPGFYNSIFDSMIDSEVEQEREEKGGEWPDYEVNFEELSRKILAEFCKRVGIAMDFEELKRPREYNFQTDRIFAQVEMAEIEKIWKEKECDLVKLEERIKDRFSSRDGFISFYSSDLGDWPRELKEWDHNQLSTLLEVYLEGKEFDLDQIWAEIAEELAGNGVFMEVLEFK